MSKALSRFLAVVLLLAGLVAAGPACAHKMKIFATIEGDAIVGSAYFSPGGRVRDAEAILSIGGEDVARTRTGEDGSFRFTPTRPGPYRIAVDGGDGHAAFFILADSAPPATPAPLSTPAAVSDTAIEQAIARQIRPLREQIDAYEEKIRLHDILGGLGIIAGLAGVAFGLSERRKRRASEGSGDKK